MRSIDQIAFAAVNAFPPEKQIRMVAIAGAESGFDPAARGDRLDSFPPNLRSRYEPFAVDGFLSFGAWQIFLGVHSDRVRILSGLESQAELAEWLSVPHNNARAAATILADQGFEAWSTYNIASYLPFEIEASAAVTKALEQIRNIEPFPYVAVSLNGNVLHFDRPDGTFHEVEINKVGVFQPWLRFELDPPR